jgi:hypothetical protein
MFGGRIFTPFIFGNHVEDLSLDILSRMRLMFDNSLNGWESSEKILGIGS